MRSTLFLLSFFLEIVFLFSCTNKKTLFEQISSGHSGIHFKNQINENDTTNVLDLSNIYNGGGVGVGDFNNDGLQDIYFTGNQVSNKLYLNKGDFKFEDVTDKSGVDGAGRWSRGVSVVDINNDGLMDIYVCTTLSKDPEKRRNLLYVNQGIDKDGIPHFKEMAKEYGLDDTSHSTMAAFFDFDNDGDLDMYLVVNEIHMDNSPAVFRPIKKDGANPSTGRLYQNNWDPVLKHPVFKDISKQAGITIEGYGHSVTIADINKDGWKDIYVSNDYLSNDILYINNHDGTFTDQSSKYFKHTSTNAMGQDIEDINNDGLEDLIELDMSPEDNYRKKTMTGGNSYQTYQNFDYFGYEYQYPRNTLQLNMGPRVGKNDSVGDPVFSEIGFMSGIAETDWSWTPVIADFNNDGFRDLIVTNGFPKDVTDHDFIAFRNHSIDIASKDILLKQIPEVKLHNYAFRNNGDLTFSNVSNDWGLEAKTFSNGAAYADLDNDGNMDLIINNINDEALIYRNTSGDHKDSLHNYINLKLEGDSLNKNGLGAWIEIHYNGKHQVYEQNPYRGYLSTIQLNPHFGLGNTKNIDSLIIKWPNGHEQIIQNERANQTLTISIKNADQTYTWTKPVYADAYLKDITDSLGIQYVHRETDFIDFNIQKLLPHKFSQYGPAIAVGDVDGNGLEDMVVGGSYTSPAVLLLQQKNGRFIQKNLPEIELPSLHWQDMGISLFDADGDGDLDLYIARGGYQEAPNSGSYQDRFYINDGKGNFTMDSLALPKDLISKSCIRIADYDHDGKPDLFIGGRVEPWNYPKPVSSIILHNDSKNKIVHFTDVTSTVAPSLINIGLVCDAIWTDMDNDGWPDLILAGEWMPITILKNNKGVFQNITSKSGIANKKGWWTSIVSGDFDNDGKTDYIIGNLGLNSFYRGNDQHPVRIYAKDFDKNGSYDAIPTTFLPASEEDTTRKEFPVHTKDDITKQMISFRSRYPTYKSYASATFDHLFSAEEMKGALILEANYFSNSLLKNLGNGQFKLIPLPNAAQTSCMNGMLAEDIDGDGNLDLVINGNDFGTEPSVGRYDACNGTVLKGDGKNSFTVMPMLKSGLFIPGNGKALVKLNNGKGQTMFAASQNRGQLKVFLLKENVNSIALQPNEIQAIYHFTDGRLQKRELNFGSSFLSQSGRFLSISKNVQFIDIKDYNGKTRRLQFQ